MSSDLLCSKYLEDFSFAHVSDGFHEDDGWDMLNPFMALEGSPLDHVKDLKDRGNSLFKQKNFDVAAACYDKACKLLGFALGGLKGYDVRNVCDLAVSLNLNLAASAIKLLEYEAAKDLCSLVLSVFPHTVKALFRRALAFMGLKLFIQAKVDLERAMLVEPKNKDILRELAVVNNYLKINSNGKRKLEVDCEENVNNLSLDSNKHLVEHGENVNLVEQGECSQSHSCSKLRLDRKDPILNADKSDCPNMEIDSEADIQQVGDKMFNFGKKGDIRTNLRISASTYQKLLDGSEVSFYQNYHLTRMKIRVLKPCTEEVNTQPNTPHKKKKKKRRPRKKKAKTNNTNTTTKVLAPSNPYNTEACERETIDKKNIIEVSAASVETLMVEEEIGVVENDVHQIQDTDNSPSISAATIRRKFKRLPSSVTRLYMNQSGDADPPDVSRLKTLASNTRTKLRVQRFRHSGAPKIHEIKNSQSFTRFPSNREAKFNFPRPRCVSLYYSRNNLSSTKRKSAENPDFMNLPFMPTKKQCQNLYPSTFFSISSTSMLNKFVCNYGSESQDSV